MEKRRKRYTKKSVMKAAIFTIILMVLVVLVTYIIFHTDWLRPEINKITASYISLNTNDTTDILKITDLHKLTDKKGINNNKYSKNFQITGEKDTTYKIVLYHLGNKIDDKFVKFYLTNEKNKVFQGNLMNQEESYDGGRVIFEGTLKDGKNWNLKMWVDKSYHKKVKNISYEIRIKSR